MKFIPEARSVLLVLTQFKLTYQALTHVRLTVCSVLVFLFTLLPMNISTLHADDSEDDAEVGIMVVTNIDVEMPSIDDTEIQRLFLGKSRRLPNGDRAALAAFAPSRTFFNSRVLGRSDTDVARIWSKLKFSGRQAPPRTFDTIDEVVAYVKSTPNALAYLPSTYRGGDVRIMSLIPGNAPSLR